MIQKHFRIKPTKKDEEVHICFCYSERSKQGDPVIIFSHGFTVDGVESHRMFYEMAESFVKNGLNCVLFDYRGCGYSSGAFKNLCPSQEIKDLLAVYKFVLEELNITNKHIGLFGQSHGSYISLLTIPKMPLVKSVCLWGVSAAPLKRYKANFKKLARFNDLLVLDKGFLLSQTFLEDMAEHDAIEACHKISCPILFVHAGDDNIVPIEDGRKAYEEVSSNEKHFEVIDGGNHSYKRQPQLQQLATKLTLDWFCKYLF